MEGIAQAWLVLTLTHDPVALGVRSACQFVPVLALGLFGGIIADVLPKRRTLVMTQASSAAVSFVVWALVLLNQINIWEIYALAACLGIINAVDMPVRQAFVVEMVGREDIVNAVALNSAVFNSARVVGPAVAGILIGLIGLAPAFFLNGCSFVAVIGALLMMRESELLPARRLAFVRSVSGVVGQLSEGLAYIRRTPSILIAITVLGVVATVALNFSVVMPIYASESLHGGADTYGFLMAAAGVGSLASSLAIAYSQRPTLRLLLVGATVTGLATVGLGLTQVFAFSLVIMAVLGSSVIAMSATTNTLIQLAVPDQLRGRVMSVYTTVFAGSTPVGGLFSGVLTGATSVAVTLLVSGGLAIVVAGAAATRLPRGGRPDAPVGAGGLA
jgi:MFS family permease